MSVEAAERYVRAGAALLDEKGPEGWRERLYERRGELDVASTLFCPLGLLYGSYSGGKHALGFYIKGDPLYDQESWEYGFDCACDPEELYAANYTELTRAWLDEIEPLISDHTAQ